MQVSKMFKVFDQKADGVITISELRATLDALGEKLSEEEIDEMMREADKCQQLILEVQCALCAVHCASHRLS